MHEKPPNALAMTVLPQLAKSSLEHLALQRHNFLQIRRQWMLVAAGKAKDGHLSDDRVVLDPSRMHEKPLNALAATVLPQQAQSSLEHLALQRLNLLQIRKLWMRVAAGKAKDGHLSVGRVVLVA